MKGSRPWETCPTLPIEPHRFWQAMHGLASVPTVDEPSAALLRDIVEAWGNNWSAKEEYLAEVVRHARVAGGPILECGSGLTTVVLAMLCARTANRMWSLEHMPHWGRQAQRGLRLEHAGCVDLHIGPLRDYGSFLWYDPPLQSMPDDFALVVCDGPPGKTLGGRSGLLPVLGPRLRPGCIILLDDVARPGEKALVKAWSKQLSVPFKVGGVSKPFAILRLPDTKGSLPLELSDSE